jgi:recombination protein RecT
MSRDIQNRNGAAPATRRGFLELLEVAKPQIAAILPVGVDVDRVIQIARSVWLSDPKIQACDPGSFIRVVGQASQLGLELGGPKQEAYPVPFKGVCTLIVGYRGLAELARRSGKVLDIDADVVRQGDAFRYGRNPLPFLEHIPALSNRGEVTHIYAVAALPGGLFKYSVMEADEVDAIRKRSRMGDQGAWVSDWCEMGKKTPIRRLCKLLPMSVELANAIAHDNETDGLAERAQQAPQQARPGVAERVMGRLSPPTQETQEDAPWSPDEPGADDDPEQRGEAK